jgi:gas vesicle protein
MATTQTENSMEKSYSLIAIIGLAAALSACDKPGPAERAGEKIDNTVEQARDKVEDIVEPSEGPAEKAGENIDEAVEATRDQLEETKKDITEQTQ